MEEKYGGGEEHTRQQQFRVKVVMHMLLNVSDLYSTKFLPLFDLFFTGHLQILIHALTNKQTICAFCSCILFYKGQFAKKTVSASTFCVNVNGTVSKKLLYFLYIPPKTCTFSKIQSENVVFLY